MLTEARSSKSPIGFLDPRLVAIDTINEDASFIESYITSTLLAHCDKEFVLMPYNEHFHWILIVLIPKWNKAIYVDSLSKKKSKYTAIAEILDR